MGICCTSSSHSLVIPGCVLESDALERSDRLLVINLKSARLITSHQAITECDGYLFLDSIHLDADKH